MGLQFSKGTGNTSHDVGAGEDPELVFRRGTVHSPLPRSTNTVEAVTNLEAMVEADMTNEHLDQGIWARTRAQVQEQLEGARTVKYQFNAEK